jgi:hypothetical protein
VAEPAPAEHPSPPAPPTPPAPPPPAWSPEPETGESGGLLEERPEIKVGAAFAGGFVLAMILKRLAR